MFCKHVWNYYSNDSVKGCLECGMVEAVKQATPFVKRPEGTQQVIDSVVQLLDAQDEKVLLLAKRLQDSENAAFDKINKLKQEIEYLKAERDYHKQEADKVVNSWNELPRQEDFEKVLKERDEWNQLHQYELNEHKKTVLTLFEVYKERDEYKEKYEEWKTKYYTDVKPAHDCHKNQDFRWGDNNGIDKVWCHICKKVLYEAPNE